jgi:hypothetical protein
MTATANDQKTGRAVAGEELFESLAHFVVIHNGQAPERAQRIGTVISKTQFDAATLARTGTGRTTAGAGRASRGGHRRHQHKSDLQLEF